MTDPDGEWITIPEFARRLGQSERQARRLAKCLREEDRTPEGTRPARVRWCPATSGKSAEEDAECAENHAECAPFGPDQGQNSPIQSPAMSGECPADVRHDVHSVHLVHDVHYELLAANLAALQQQLAIKDAQLAEKDAQIAKLQAAARTEQEFRVVETARSMQAQIEPPRRNFVQRLLAAWHDRRTDQ